MFYVAITIAVLLFSYSSLSAGDWTKHRETIGSHPDLIRYYVFEDLDEAKKTVKNIAAKPDVEDSDFSYKTKHPFETVDGPFAGSKAVRLDAGWFESSKPKLGKAFSVELRLKKLGQGSERGNAGATNGTLFGLGNGWDNGIRLTTQYPAQNLSFCIGRNTKEKSKNLVVNRSISDEIWLHIATVWDGKTMRLYLDGILYGITDYDGVLTEPCWGFRVGFNDAGVGSVQMDLAEVAVYRAALEPERILAHALLQPEFSEKQVVFYREATDAVSQKRFDEAQRKIEELLKLKMSVEYQNQLRLFQIDLAESSGRKIHARRLTAELIDRPETPEKIKTILFRKLVSSNYIAPPAIGSSEFYRKVLNDESAELEEKQQAATEKCLAESLFTEGKTDEAKTILKSLKDWEKQLNQNDLEEQNLSAEPTELYENYRKNLCGVVQDDRMSVADLIKGNEQDLFFVAPDGSDDNPGTKEKPFASIEQARNAIRKLKADGKFPDEEICVRIRGGIYSVTKTCSFESQDSGTPGAKIVYQAMDQEKPIFSGGIDVRKFKKIDDRAVLERLPEESRNKVFVAAVPDEIQFPSVKPRGYGKNGTHAAPSVELFIDDKAQQIARWPNSPKPDAPDSLKASENAFVKTGKIHRGQFKTPESNQPGIFEYSDPRHERWTQAPDFMLFGYWGHLWGITSCKVERIDKKKKQVVLSTNNPYGYRENMPYYAFNLLEEIDEPGEWYLDRQNKKLYVFPPDNVDLNSAKVRLSFFSGPFFDMKNVSNLALVGLNFEEGTGTAGRIQGGENVCLVGCRFDRFGNWGLDVEGLKHHVLACDFTTLGGGGVRLKGGDVKTLSPGGCRLENCLVEDFGRVDRAYAPAVLVEGVKNIVAHNRFCDSPAHAIRAEGMEHVFEFNEIHSVVYESDDQAGIDIWGNPYIRGIIIRYNYWHHIGSGRDVAGQSGIRLDDMISGVLIYGNVFFRSGGGHFGGVQIHGGKDNIVDNNLLIDCKYAVSFSPWGERRWLEMLDGHFGQNSRKQGFDPDSEIYRNKYPDYLDINSNADRNFITRNAAIGCDEFARNGRRNVFRENVMLPWMPELFSETRGMQKPSDQRVPLDARKIRQRLSIPQDSPIYELLDMNPLPVDRMGLYVDGFRKKIPETKITPYFVLE